MSRRICCNTCRCTKLQRSRRETRVEAGLMGYNERKVRECHGEYVAILADVPSFKEAGVELEKGLEGHQPFFELLACRVHPVRLTLKACLGPTIGKVFHWVDGSHGTPDPIGSLLAMLIVSESVTKKKTRRERKDLWDKNVGVGVGLETTHP